MKIELSEKQAQMIATLGMQRDALDAQLRVVYATIAAGADIEAWESAEFDGKAVTFKVPEAPQE